jgi:hypothetical protein
VRLIAFLAQGGVTPETQRPVSCNANGELVK